MSLAQVGDLERVGTMTLLHLAIYAGALAWIPTMLISSWFDEESKANTYIITFLFLICFKFCLCSLSEFGAYAILGVENSIE